MILYTSDINSNSPKALRTSLIYLIVSLFCALFGAVYEKFSHEVYSYYMIYAFVFPLVGGVLLFLVFSVIGLDQYPHHYACKLYHSGIAALTIGSIIRGVLDIYGTTNALADYYWIFGSLFVLGGIGMEIIIRLIPKRLRRE